MSSIAEQKKLNFLYLKLNLKRKVHAYFSVPPYKGSDKVFQTKETPQDSQEVN